MSCDFTGGRLEACKEAVGGLRNLYIANFDSDMFDGLTLDDDEQITALTTAVTVYKFELRGENNTFEETNENSRDNGTSFWTQTGNIVLKVQDLKTQAQLKLMSYGRPHIIIEDYNGKFRLAGAQNGVEVSVNTSTGGAMGDLNGYNISFEGKELGPALFVDSALMGDAAGFDINSAVMNA
jgi:predicted Zn-dependent protease with MMP-like domain